VRCPGPCVILAPTARIPPPAAGIGRECFDLAGHQLDLTDASLLWSDLIARLLLIAGGALWGEPDLVNEPDIHLCVSVQVPECVSKKKEKKK
jgi:hypothetical protein